MNRILVMLTSLLIFSSSSLAMAGPKEEVGAAPRAWIEAMTNRDAERVVVLGEERIRVYGDIAINSGTYTFSEDRDGKSITRPARFSFVYRRAMADRGSPLVHSTCAPSVGVSPG